MSKVVLGVALAIALWSVSANAEDGRPSSSKLSKLGLNSLNVVSDDQGMEVRGEGIGIVGGRFFSLAATSFAHSAGGVVAGPANPANGVFGTINPATGVNTPFTANFVQGPAPFLQVTASTYGQVLGFAN